MKAVRDSTNRDLEKYWELLTRLKTCKGVFAKSIY
jgi:hypothetical protein